ncbi:MAG: DHHA1 domain-containing protein [Desulfobacterales bacterium]
MKSLAAVVGGSGGGRPDMAQAGGNQPENIDKALEKAYEVVEQQ